MIDVVRHVHPHQQRDHERVLLADVVGDHVGVHHGHRVADQQRHLDRNVYGHRVPFVVPHHDGLDVAVVVGHVHGHRERDHHGHVQRHGIAHDVGHVELVEHGHVERDHYSLEL